MDIAATGLADLFLFLKGIAIGIAIAAPVGPVAILCIRRTIFYRPRYGLAPRLRAVPPPPGGSAPPGGPAPPPPDPFSGPTAPSGAAGVAEPLLEHQTTLRFVGAF